MSRSKTKDATAGRSQVDLAERVLPHQDIQCLSSVQNSQAAATAFDPFLNRTMTHTPLLSGGVGFSNLARGAHYLPTACGPTNPTEPMPIQAGGCTKLSPTLLVSLTPPLSVTPQMSMSLVPRRSAFKTTLTRTPNNHQMRRQPVPVRGQKMLPRPPVSP